MLREDAQPAQKPARGGKTRAGEAVEGAGNATFEALRAWRTREAKAQGVPPYVIFHDSVLHEIAADRPAGLNELGRIKGVGASKLGRYGTAVLGVLRETT